MKYHLRPSFQSPAQGRSFVTGSIPTARIGGEEEFQSPAQGRSFVTLRPYYTRWRTQKSRGDSEPPPESPKFDS
jgi:hypothetical protein